MLLTAGKVTTFHLHVIQEVGVESKWEFVDLKLKIFFCFNSV